MSSLNSVMENVMVHELGHSAGGLADEYWYSGYEAPNMTRDNNLITNKWRHWWGIDGVGAYLHSDAPTSAGNWYRPHQSCMMRYSSSPFCRVCATELTRRMALINAEPFHGQSSATNVTMPNGTTRIVDYAFYGCTGLTIVTIPNSVTTIGQYAFLKCTGLTRIVNWATMPQQISANNIFSGVVRSNIDLYVPKGKAAAYNVADWTGFRNVFEIDIAASIPGLAWNGQWQFDSVSLSGKNSFSGNIYVTINKRNSFGILYTESKTISIYDGDGSYYPVSTSAYISNENEYLEILIYDSAESSNTITRQLIRPVVFTF